MTTTTSRTQIAQATSNNHITATIDKVITALYNTHYEVNCYAENGWLVSVGRFETTIEANKLFWEWANR